MEEEPFNPDYVEVDRVLEVSFCEDKDTGEVNIWWKYFLGTKKLKLSKYSNIVLFIKLKILKKIHFFN
jgi:hypothetical protein